MVWVVGRPPDDDAIAEGAGVEAANRASGEGELVEVEGGTDGGEKEEAVASR